MLVDNFNADDAAQPRPVETTAEQMQTANEGEEEEEASDGSDSGLGLEPSRNVAPCGTGTSSSNSSSSNSSPLQRPPIKSSLKRRSEPVDASASVQQEKEDGVSSQKRPKKGITFEGVTVYYFPRIQGFGCVPSQGGCTLGMEFQHVHSRRLTLSEHSAEQRKVHRQQNQELNPRSSSSEDTSSEEEPSESGSEAESESYGFLQPVSTRQRRALLKAAGVRKIDPTEKDDCREIRTSREVCGCTCRGYCDPSRCACSLAGIKCQVDRPNFPCGCTLEGCANTAGRVEFNPGRVRTHFLHTIMKLRMEGDDRRALEGARGGNVAMLSRASSNATVSDTNESGYVIGSEKNWSNGPVRLPSGVVSAYGAGILPGPSSAVTEMVDGIGQMHPVPGLLHHHSPLAHHQPPMDGLLHSTAGHLQQQQLHHLTHQVAPYLNHHGPDASHQNYLDPSSSNASHLLGSSVLPAASSDPTLDLHYPFRDYYGGLEGAASGGESTNFPGIPMHQLSACANASEPPSSHHADLYYRGNYGSFVAGGASTTANLDAYRQDSMVPLHVPNTGHDRLLPSETSSFATHPEQHTTPGNLPGLPPKGPDCASKPCQSSVSKVPQQDDSSKEPTTTATVSLSSSAAPSQEPMMQPVSSVPPLT
uniref:CSRNP_N domain-containing protein n=1 Tax=Anopheles maculatus TaxID=74869 RepID=A0A182SB35_9DIPT